MIFYAINFFGNAFKYRLLRKEKIVVLAFHLAFFLIIIGAGVTRYISFEGIMPIKEGQVTNKFLTEKNYISIVVNDGNEQKTPVHHSILLSALGSNNYSYNTDFKGKDVEVKLTNYIPNAQQVFEESETGDEYMLFVESGAGGRHNHYIKRGTSELVHGVVIGYDVQNKNTINLYGDGEQSRDYIFIDDLISLLVKSITISAGIFSAAHLNSIFLLTMFKTPPIFNPGQFSLLINFTGILTVTFVPALIF